MNKYSNVILLSILLILFLFLWLIVNIKTSFLFIGIFSLLMFFNVVITSLSNVMAGKNLPEEGTTFWKLILITISSISLGIVLTI